MKQLFLCLMAMFLASPLVAEEQFINLSLGSASGSLDYQTTDSELKAFDSGFDHDLSGTGLVVNYMKITDGGLTWGAGYHSFNLKGKSDSTTDNDFNYDGDSYRLTATLETTSLQVSGLFGMVGYDLGSDNVHIIPQVRLGLGNNISYKAQVDLTLTQLGDSASGSGSISEGGSGTPLILVLPIYFQMGDVLIGAEAQFLGTGLIYDDGTDTYTAIATSAMMLTVGKTF